MELPTSILITGASSGIGEALARAYADPGVFLALGGRDRSRLNRVAESCMLLGATAAAATIDVTDRAALAAWIAEIDRVHPLDLVIANAGVSGGTLGGGESEEQTKRIMAINIDGVLNTVAPAVAAMAPRRRGQIALMSSLASFRGFPGAPAYGASKAFVRVWGEAMRPELARQGLELSVICPGFVESRMTAGNAFRMPFLMSADDAAAIIVDRLARKRARIAFPWPMYVAARLGAWLSPNLSDAVIRRLPRKG